MILLACHILENIVNVSGVTGASCGYQFVLLSVTNNLVLGDLVDPRHVFVVSNNNDPGFDGGNLPAPLSLRHCFAF